MSGLIPLRYPNEIAWTLKHEHPGPDCHDASLDSGEYPYDTPNFEYKTVLSEQICAGQEYCFDITDLYGDGICCYEGEGSYQLELDGAVVASGGDYGAGEKTCFTAPYVTTCADAGCDTGCLTFDENGHPTCEAGLGRPECEATAGASRFCGYEAPGQVHLASPGEIQNTVLVHFTADAPDSTKFKIEWSVLNAPTQSPTALPTTAVPTAEPSSAPTPRPTVGPSAAPSPSPTTQPVQSPTTQPAQSPTSQPAQSPTAPSPTQ